MYLSLHVADFTSLKYHGNVENTSIVICLVCSLSFTPGIVQGAKEMAQARKQTLVQFFLSANVQQLSKCTATLIRKKQRLNNSVRSVAILNNHAVSCLKEILTCALLLGFPVLILSCVGPLHFIVSVLRVFLEDI